MLMFSNKLPTFFVYPVFHNLDSNIKKHGFHGTVLLKFFTILNPLGHKVNLLKKHPWNPGSSHTKKPDLIKFVHHSFFTKLKSLLLNSLQQKIRIKDLKHEL